MPSCSNQQCKTKDKPSATGHFLHSHRLSPHSNSQIVYTYLQKSNSCKMHLTAINLCKLYIQPVGSFVTKAPLAKASQHSPNRNRNENIQPITTSGGTLPQRCRKHHRPSWPHSPQAHPKNQMRPRQIKRRIHHHPGVCLLHGYRRRTHP